MTSKESKQACMFCKKTNPMRQIAKSVGPHSLDAGYQSTEDQLNEITGICRQKLERIRNFT
ncbi:MAG: hypothetical protein ACI8R8_002607 [Paraglaciecola sp.]|jgi:hypothetical protein